MQVMTHIDYFFLNAFIQNIYNRKGNFVLSIMLLKSAQKLPLHSCTIPIIITIKRATTFATVKTFCTILLNLTLTQLVNVNKAEIHKQAVNFSLL